jgi:hypothetical protein
MAQIFNEDDGKTTYHLWCAAYKGQMRMESYLNAKKGFKKDGGAATMGKEPSVLRLQARGSEGRRLPWPKKETVTFTTRK